MKDGNISLLPWGRRKEQEGNLPLGGWARLDSINAVKIAVEAFMEKSHWFVYSGIGGTLQ
jgi:hypothetical protein